MSNCVSQTAARATPIGCRRRKTFLKRPRPVKPEADKAAILVITTASKVDELHPLDLLDLRLAIPCGILCWILEQRSDHAAEW
ncbi:hypothetical protein BQ8794_240023 [Mesorhizobium prunaredense]|uniref:Uncharacterized protein n=2 Tax=Mesorhizobium TaxID=68287 RepID=A0A1R3V7D6_9HYPH|nr:conserved hypothetical protein [Mesorhizobium ventifaucium]SIT55816.1 hypothetical protein BQ8794_240023 [Mesorhizobium prunaredense]